MTNPIARARVIYQVVALLALTAAFAAPCFAESSASPDAAFDPASVLADAYPASKPSAAAAAVPASSKSAATRADAVQADPDKIGLTPDRPIPEPGSLALAAFGAAALAGVWRRARRA